MKKMLHLLVLLVTFTACTEHKSSTDVSDEVNTSTGLNSDLPDNPPSDDYTPDESEPSVSADAITQEFMTLLNNHRQSLGLKSLVLVDGLSDIVKDHSEAMANGQVAFGHTGFSARCSESRAVLGGGNLCAENVAMGQKTAQAVFTAWMNSSGHRANMEQSRATHTGFGYAQSSSGTYYWTQIFLEKN